jgi:prolyl oligopeptidase
MHKASARVALVVALVSGCGPASHPSTKGTDMSQNPETSMTDAAPPTETKPRRAYDYPPAKTVDVVDDYHGTKVADPYRWLEDADAPDTAEWVTAQNRLTFSFLEQIPERGPIKDRLTALWNYERFGAPYKEGGRYFFQKNDGLQNQAVLYVAKSLDDPAPRVLLDPNTLSTDGTVALGTYSVSEDGKLLAYTISAAGSDWSEIRVRDVATGKDLPDELKWIKWSGASWSKDGRGFYYSRYDEPKPGEELAQTNYYMKLYYHRLGTPQSEDQLIYKRDDQKEWGFGAGVTEDGRYLIITVSKGTDDKYQVFYKDLRAKGQAAEVVELLTGFEHEYSFIGNVGTTFYFKTDLDAPRKRIIAIDIKKPGKASWKEIVPQRAETLAGATMVGGVILADYLKDAHTEVRVHDLAGKHIRDVDLPGIGTAEGFGGKMKDTETFYVYGSYTTPAAVYRYDVKKGVSTLWRAPKVDFDAGAYAVDQVFYTSKDGTRVPMFIVHRKDVKRDGQNPTILYGYGGFNIPLTPGFSVPLIVWLEMGGVYAVANLRGGGEYGEEWHQAGTRLKKQNVFDDFIAAAEYLIAEKWTSTPKLAISGGSNGGLLVGACMLQRPDLFGAALPAVGVMDMLRFHKFTIGWAWVDDYGSSDDAAEFKALYAYSPYHNIEPGVKYPATLVTTADHDDRVVPGHSFKFTARLQAAQAGDAPILIRVDVRAGHGAGKPTTKLIETQADVFAFLVKVLGVQKPR